MPRNANGQYFLPEGNPVNSGELITAEWANKTLGDLSNALSDSLDRDGLGGMRAPLRFVDGTTATPAVSFSSDTTTGVYKSGSNELGISAGGKTIARFRGTDVDIAGALTAASIGGAASTGAGASGTWGINVTGNASYATTAGAAVSAVTATKVTNDENAMTFHWSGQGGQPTYLWGGNDSTNMYLYNPSNFRVDSSFITERVKLTGNGNTEFAWVDKGSVTSYFWGTNDGGVTYLVSNTSLRAGLAQPAGGSYTWTAQQNFVGNIFSQSYNFDAADAIYFSDGKIQFAIGAQPQMAISGNGTFEIKGGAYKPGGGVWADSSDSRIKADIAPLQGALSKLMQLRPVDYELLTSDASGQTAGFIAQEVREVFPDAVSEREPDAAESEFIPKGENILCVGWKNDFFAYIVGAIQDLSRQNEALQAQINTLNGAKK